MTGEEKTWWHFGVSVEATRSEADELADILAAHVCGHGYLYHRIQRVPLIRRWFPCRQFAFGQRPILTPDTDMWIPNLVAPGQSFCISNVATGCSSITLTTWPL